MNSVEALRRGEISAIRLAVMALLATHQDPKALLAAFTTYLEGQLTAMTNLGARQELTGAIRFHAESLLKHVSGYVSPHPPDEALN
jgi:hypothetical protein